MRHLIKGRKLSRNPSHRLALLRNLACSLFAHEKITTTKAKAKELRPFAEKLITIAKRGAEDQQAAASATGEEARAAKANALAHRRRLIQRLGGKRWIRVGKDDVNIVEKLLADIGPRYADRPGGYLRILKLSTRRLGDAAPTAMIEMLRAGETRKKAAAPAPTVASET